MSGGASPALQGSYVILLRGVNVGGRNKVVMSEMRERLARAGFCTVTTYLNSGNVVISSELGVGETSRLVGEVLSAYPFSLRSLIMQGEDYLRESALAPSWWHEPLARRDALFLTDEVDLDHVRKRISHMPLGAELVAFGERVVFWGKTDEKQFLRTAYHRLLLKEDFYPLITIRNGNTFDCLAQMLGDRSHPCG